MKRSLRALGLRLLQVASVRRAALKRAAARERALIILYHRVVPSADYRKSPGGDIVPTVTTALFRQQLEALAGIGDFVPLMSLVDSLANTSPAKTPRVRLAITFDDDDPSHARHALPILQSLGFPATFFLSGRALRGLGPPWWILLEAGILRNGLDRTAAQLGVGGARTATDLAAACEGTPLTGVIERTFPPPEGDSLLSRKEIRMLVDAGMSVGFHTLDHPVLTQLPDAEVSRALTLGRGALAEAVGAGITLFAYPHGRVDSRIASHVPKAGYRAALRSGQRPVGPGSDLFLLGRWEPGPLGVRDLIAEAALRLNYPIGSP